MPNESTELETNTAVDGQVDPLVNCFDKHGTKIRNGNAVLIHNDRKDFTTYGTVLANGDILITSGREKGKFSRVKTYLDAIWWRNDTPANWLTVLDIKSHLPEVLY